MPYINNNSLPQTRPGQEPVVKTIKDHKAPTQGYDAKNESVFNHDRIIVSGPSDHSVFHGKSQILPRQLERGVYEELKEKSLKDRRVKYNVQGDASSDLVLRKAAHDFTMGLDESILRDGFINQRELMQEVKLEKREVNNDSIHHAAMPKVKKDRGMLNLLRDLFK